MNPGRPAADEHAPYFSLYIDRVPEGEITDLLRAQIVAAVGPERASALEPEYLADHPLTLPSGLRYRSNIGADALGMLATAAFSLGATVSRFSRADGLQLTFGGVGGADELVVTVRSVEGCFEAFTERGPATATTLAIPPTRFVLTPGGPATCTVDVTARAPDVRPGAAPRPLEPLRRPHVAPRRRAGRPARAADGRPVRRRGLRAPVIGARAISGRTSARACAPG